MIGFQYLIRQDVRIYPLRTMTMKHIDIRSVFGLASADVVLKSTPSDIVAATVAAFPLAAKRTTLDGIRRHAE